MKEKEADRIFTLIHMKRESFGDAHNALIGPKVYKRRDDAVTALFNAISRDIIANDPVAFIEAWRMRFPFFGIDPENYEESELVDYFNTTEPAEKENIATWYFASQDSDDHEAFFEIEEHEI